MKRKKKTPAPDFIKEASGHLTGFADTLWGEYDALEARKAPVLDVIAVAMSTAENELTQRTFADILDEDGTDDIGQQLCDEVNQWDSMSQASFFRAFTHKLLPDAKAALLKELQP